MGIAGLCRKTCWGRGLGCIGIGYRQMPSSPPQRHKQVQRIKELQARNERKAEMAALTRDELIAILTEIVQATRTRLSEARPTDGLKAAEMLARMCGWNEPERVNVQSVEVRVDAALIEQLRAGYAQLGERQAKACLLGQGDR